MTIYTNTPNLTPMTSEEIIDAMVFQRNLEDGDILFVIDKWFIMNDNNALSFGDIVNMLPSKEINDWLLTNSIPNDPNNWSLEQKILFQLRWN